MEENSKPAIAHHVIALAVQHDTTQIWLVNDESIEPALEVERPQSQMMHVRGAQERHLHSSEAHEVEYFNQISDAIVHASHVIVFGHGKGNSNMKDKFLQFVQQHRPTLFDLCIDAGNVGFAALSNGQLVALAKRVWARQ